MKSIALLFAVAIVGTAFLAGRVNSQYQYLSPLPGATMLSARTNIIVRQGDYIDPGSLTQDDVILVTGSASGVHAGALQLSDDQKTVLFQPDQPFSPGERVTVQIHKGIKTRLGASIPPTQFDFSVSATPEYGEVKASFADQIGARSFAPIQRRPPSGNAEPLDLPEILITVSRHLPQGCLFLTSSSFDTTYKGNYLMIVDSLGLPVFTRLTKSSCADFKIQPNGLLTYFDNNRVKFYAMDSTYTVIDSFQAGNAYPTDLHDLRLLPDGHALLMAFNDQRVRMDQVVPGGSPLAKVRGVILQELDQSKRVVFQWRSWDHFDITDAIQEDLTAAFVDPVHSNAIELDSDGNILLSSRHLDEITKIDRSTGAIIWRLGGRHNEFKFVNDSIGFSYQHAIRRLANGHFTLFDNGNYHTPNFSRALEYIVDEDQKVATLVWQYRNTPDIYTFAMGYVQRLDDGSTLIGWGSANPTVTIVAPDREKLYEMTFPTGVVSYRAYEFPWASKQVTGVRQPGSVPASFSLEQNFPNPFNPTTTIRYELPRVSNVRLTVFNTLGQEITTLVDETEGPGYKSVRFDSRVPGGPGSSLPSGVYFYVLRAGDFVQAKKLLLLK